MVFYQAGRFINNVDHCQMKTSLLLTLQPNNFTDVFCYYDRTLAVELLY
jgi:hypothetical protein